MLRLLFISHVINVIKYHHFQIDVDDKVTVVVVVVGLAFKNLLQAAKRVVFVVKTASIRMEEDRSLWRPIDRSFRKQVCCAHSFGAGAAASISTSKCGNVGDIHN